jgi:glutaredoxin 3
MNPKRKIEIFSAGCATCRETIEMVKQLAGENTVQIHDMHQPDIATRAKEHGIRSLPAVVIDGKIAGCCAGRGPDEHVLREALR